MNFFLQNRIVLLFTIGAVVLIAALFWPEAKKSGEIQKYYSIPTGQLTTLEYNGEMSLSEKTKVRIEYAIHREENVLKPKEPLYRIEIKNLTTTDAALAPRVAELKQVKNFYASALVRTIVQDWSEPDFYYVLKHEPERDSEYGLKDCTNKLALTFRSNKKQFCIGTSSQGDTRRYLLDIEKDKLLITPDFTVRRILNNIFAQREQSIHPFGPEGADTIEAKIEPDLLQKFPLVREKTGGLLKFRMLVNSEGKNKINVWHVEGLLSIKPSHAAEFAQLLSALRISAPFVTNAIAAEKPLEEMQRAAGLDAKQRPGLTGSVKVKKTDQPDVLLTAFAFFPPGIKPTPQPAWQMDQQLSRPLDTLLVSHFNAGYITADLYPRLTSILTKFENDLIDAQKKGALEKAEREKKEKEKSAQEPVFPPKK